MKTRILFTSVLLLAVALLSACSNSISPISPGTTSDTTDTDASPLASFPLEKALANGKPTLAEFGWRECIPCKSMRPILEELAKAYKDKLNVVIVEIPYHEDLADKYDIMVMPVQIFFDSNGKEMVRHAGFLGKEQIIPHLNIMGIYK